MQDFLLQTTHIIDLLAVFVLLIGFVVVTACALPDAIAALKHKSSNEFYNGFRTLRLHLGQTLLLALEILIVSDIVLSILHRTIEEITILGVTVLIRIVLSYFLNLELDHLEKK